MTKSLENTKKTFFSNMLRMVQAKKTIDANLLDDIEELLIQADVGISTTLKILAELEKTVKNKKYTNPKELHLYLRDILLNIFEQQGVFTPLIDIEKNDKKPFVILVVGINGVGKTTSIGKLAKHFISNNKKVILGAADTFRAAAIDQLSIWADRSGASIIKHNMGADPSAVAYDTIQSAIAKNIDIAIIDTAGRLHNKTHLMDELSKIKKTIHKVSADISYEVILVLDASTGQNAFEQAEKFGLATQVNSLIITKLDGTAKGGVVLGIVDQFKTPVRYIGTGEKITDFEIFDPKSFVNTFFKLD